jgi:hypothetical protein
MKPPVRMLDDDTLAPQLRRDLERTHAASDPYDVMAGEQRLTAALSLGAATLAVEQVALEQVALEQVALEQVALEQVALEQVAAASAELGSVGQVAASASSSGLLTSGAVNLGIGVALAAAVTAGVLAWPDRAQPPPSPRAVAARAPSTSSTPPAPQPPAHATTRSPEHTVARSSPAPAPPPESAPAATVNSHGDAALRREIAQVARIKQLLETEPLQAYRLAEAGHRTFALGMLREEREALAVLALLRAGRDSAARPRGRAFVEHYPHSAHREEIERRLQLVREPDARPR